MNIVLIVVCFVASVLLSLLINVFMCTQLLQNALCKFLLTRYTNLHYYYNHYLLCSGHAHFDNVWCEASQHWLVLLQRRIFDHGYLNISFSQADGLYCRFFFVDI